MQRLIIRLGSQEADPIQWLVYNEQQQEIIASGQLKSINDLASLKERASSAEIIALAPASDVYFTQVQLPKSSSRKALAAIPFMVEEELCGDVSTLFFALGKREENLQEVAVIDKQKLVAWQTAFSDADLFCTSLIPDAYCLKTTDSMSMLEISDSLLVNFPDGKCLEGESSWLLPLALEQANKQSLSVKCYSEIQHWPSTQDADFDFDLLPMQLLLQGAVDTQLNLFQGEFAVKRKVNPTWHKWKLAAALAVIAICANLVIKATELNTLKSERAIVNQQIDAAVNKGFPNLGTYRNLRIAIQTQMDSLEKGGGSLSMLAMLSRLSGAFEATGVKPQNIRFDGKRSEIRMQSVAQNFESLEKFRRDAQELGFEIDQGPINNRGTEVVGVITVKGK
jgi:general secretion pathway protein L